jgi:hypothetical protein
MTSRAGGTVELEQRVCRTKQPVLVHGVELDTLAIPRSFGSAHQRDVVVMDNIETLCQDLLETGRLEKWKSSLLGGQRREKAERALEPVHRYIRTIFVSFRGLPSSRNAVRRCSESHRRNDLAAPAHWIVGARRRRPSQSYKTDRGRNHTKKKKPVILNLVEQRVESSGERSAP